VFRYWEATGGTTGVDVCLLTLADYLGGVGATLTLPGWIQHLQSIRPLLDGYFKRRQEVVAPPPLLTGHDLMAELRLDPGPDLGRLLRVLLEAQAVGEIATRDQALDLARRWLEKRTPDADE
jgi:poly(A) polymerase/tRNA nucleotidyltransferase (CCA-adding enzyme)